MANKNINVRKIGIISVEAKLGDIPQAVIGDIETGEELGYLTPFRACSFQVSGDRRGSGDYGSTQVFGINNVLMSETKGHAPSNMNWTETQFELLKGMACMACLKFASHCSRPVRGVETVASFVLDSGYSTNAERRLLSNGRYLPMLFSTYMDQFIGESIIWVTNNNAGIWTRERP